MNYQVKAPSGLNVRSGPGTDYEVLDWLIDGTIIPGLDDLPWLPYIYQEDESGVTFGWVATKYLVKVEMPKPTVVKGEPSWIKWARTKLGTKEMPGAGDNPEILAWFTLTTLPKDMWHDATPWCAVFVNAALLLNGIRSLGSAKAFDYASLGTKATTPQVGDIAIFSFSHVSFYLSGAGTGTIKAIGGNQSDAVTIANYNESDVQEYRRVA